jgi:DNA-binding transcriptional ArsR family regulator
MYDELDTLIHSPLRLAIMSILVSVREAEFNFLKAETKASSGNLSVQIKKLSEAGYLEVKKTFKNNYPLTTCRITERGVGAFERYVAALRQYIDNE